MMKPLDVLARAIAIPSIVLSATGTFLELGRKWADDSPSGLRARLSDGFFEHIEDRCRTRWTEIFPSDDHAGDAEDVA
jgi:hypothetical protein